MADVQFRGGIFRYSIYLLIVCGVFLLSSVVIHFVNVAYADTPPPDEDCNPHAYACQEPEPMLVNAELGTATSIEITCSNGAYDYSVYDPGTGVTETGHIGGGS